jgi:hypothetical protein
MTEREIDAAIDRAVRDLMNVDTDAAFRARVTARLQRPARRQFLRPLAAVALTATAIAAAFVWMRPSAPDAPVSTPVAGISGPGTVAPPPAMGAGTDPGPVLASTGPRTQARGRHTAAGPIPRGTVVATVAEAPASAIDPLTAIDPIDVEPISQPPIVPSEIVVAPLSPISEMQISPLDPQTVRD